MNALYDQDRIKFLNGGFNWSAMPALLLAWRGPYVFDPTHVFADVSANGGELVVTSLPLTGKIAKPGGYAGGDPALLPTVPAGTPVTFLTLIDNTFPATPALIAYIDDAEGLPFSPNGLDQIVQPDWLALRGWFRA